MLHAISSSLSDHFPLLLADDRGSKRPRSFKFENFWSCLPGFDELVQRAWDEPTGHDEPCHNLFHKFKRTGAHLAKWSRGLFSKAKLHLHAALLVILQLDIAQESRILSPNEHDLRARLKRRVISLAVLERARKKQCARIANVKEGDANTKTNSPAYQCKKKENPYTLAEKEKWLGYRPQVKRGHHPHPFSEYHWQRSAPDPGL